MKKLTLGVVLAAASSCALADWVPTLLGGNYTGTMSYSPTATGPLSTVSSTEPITSAGDNPALPITNFGERALTIQPGLRSVIDGMVLAAAQAQGATVGASALSGALHADITPKFTSPARSQLVFSGPTYTTSISKSSVQGGITFHCTSNITLSNITVTAVYDPYSGAIDASLTPAQPLKFNTSYSSNCSSILDTIDPVVLGQIGDHLAVQAADTKVIAAVQGFQNNALQVITPLGPQYIQGFKTAVLPNIYLFAGADMGAYIQNNIGVLMAGVIKMTIGEPKVEGPYVYGTSLTAPLSYNNTEFSIEFDGFTYQLRFDVTSHRSFNYTYQCPAGSGSHGCNEP